MKALILAGGQGTRLWPLSRKQKPKQFQKLVSAKTMLQETIARVKPIFSWQDIFISTNKEYFAEVKKELPKIPSNNIIAEPLNRERVASILFFIARQRYDNLNEPLVLLPSDHSIKNSSQLLNVLKTAQNFIISHKNYIVIAGAKPAFPDTGLGYIKKGELIQNDNGIKIYQVDHFKEKPNLKRTQEYTASGEYLWNTAIYIFYPFLIGELVKKFVSDNYQRFLNIKKAFAVNDIAAVENEYSQMDKASLEYSIIENYDKTAVIESDFGWSDVGSWSVLKDVLSSPSGNFIKGNYIDIDCKNMMVYGSFDKLVAGVGVKDLIIVVTDDIILVCNKSQSQKVKKVIEKLQKQKKFNYI